MRTESFVPSLHAALAAGLLTIGSSGPGRIKCLVYGRVPRPLNLIR